MQAVVGYAFFGWDNAQLCQTTWWKTVILSEKLYLPLYLFEMINYK